MQKVTPFLMFNNRLDEALKFYVNLIPNSKIIENQKSEDGSLRAATFEIDGQKFQAFNGGDYFQFSEAFSLSISCDDQSEVDHYWEKFLEAGGTESMCGWLKDPFGLSWQIVPKRFVELIGDPNPKKAKAVSEAMMSMKKLDIRKLEEAYNNG